ncbi:MAG: hypothetical protein L3K10_00050 [Thermoplasmata archaeon]|nr:hypothetical protein [Thermoplasmata archaeon]
MGNTPDAFAYDPTTRILYCTLAGGEDDSISFVNLSTGEVERTLTGIHNAGDLLYDSSNNLLYVTNWSGLLELNGSTGSVESYLPIHWGVKPLVLDPLTGSLFVADAGNGTVYIINTSLNQVKSNLTIHNSGGGSAVAMLFDPHSRQIYTADYGDGNVSVIDATSMKVNRTTPEINLGGVLTSLALNPTTHEVYVSNCAPPPLNFRTCIIYDSNDTLASQTLPDSFPAFLAYDSASSHLRVIINYESSYGFSGSDDRQVGFVSIVTSYLGGALDSANGLEYIATPALGGVCVLPGTITVLDPSPKPSFVASLPVGDGPSQVAYDSADGRIFVTNYCSNSVSVIDATNDSIVRLDLPVGSEPYGITFDSLKDTIWIADYNSQNLTVLNGSTLATVRTVTLPLAYPYGLAIDPTAHSVFVSDIVGNAVTVVNSTTYSISTLMIPVGSSPQGIFYDPQNGNVYVANGGSDNITVINGTNDSVVESIATAGGTTALALDPIDHLILGTNAGGSRIIVLDALTNLAEFSSLPASGNPQGIVYVPTDHQVDVFNFGASAINILADAPTLSNFTANPAQSEVGTLLTFFAIAANGTPPYAFSYSGLPPGCASTDSVVIACTPTLPGQFVVTLTVVDSASYFWSATLKVSVWTHLGSGALSVRPPTIDLGMTTTFALTGAGGVPPVTYAYQGLPSGCSSSDSPFVNCTPAGVGSFVVVGFVTDNLGVVSVAATGLRVNPPPLVEAFVNTPTTILVNSSVLLLASVSGGTAPFSYSYRGLPPGCSSTDSTALGCTPTVPGNFTVTLTASDSLGRSVNASLPITVLPPPVATLPPQISAFFADPSTVTIGTNVTFYVLHTGGTPSYTLSWTGLPAACLVNNQTASTLTCRPTQVGSFSVRVNLTDALGRSVESRTSLTVLAAEPNATVPPAPPEILGLTLVYLGVIAAVIGGVVGAIATLLISRGRQKPRNDTMST